MEEIRQQFEAWAKAHFARFRGARTTSGEYKYPDFQIAWEAWMAAHDYYARPKT